MKANRREGETPMVELFERLDPSRIFTKSLSISLRNPIDESLWKLSNILITQEIREEEKCKQ